MVLSASFNNITVIRNFGLNQILKRQTSRSHYANFRLRTIVDTVATNTRIRRGRNCIIVGFKLSLLCIPFSVHLLPLVWIGLGLGLWCLVPLSTI
jgi:hypothetical protein